MRKSTWRAPSAFLSLTLVLIACGCGAPNGETADPVGSLGDRDDTAQPTEPDDPNDPQEAPEDYMYRVSVSSTGQEGNAHSWDCAQCNPITRDGRLVAFVSQSDNLVPDDTNGAIDAFVHDSVTGTTVRVDLPNAADIALLGHESNGETEEASLSADGRYVAFASRASNLVVGDDNGEQDVFVHDVQTGETTRVSVPNTGDQDSLGFEANASSQRASISADGRYVVFTSYADNLVLGDDNSRSDVFVHDRETGVTELVSVDSNGAQGSSYSENGSISADGRFVAFESLSDLDRAVPDRNETMDVYVHDRVTRKTERVSYAYDGGDAEGRFGSSHPALSDDGRFVVFYSHSYNLVPDDRNEESDIFVRDRDQGRTRRVSVPNLEDQPAVGAEADNGSQYPSISGDGRFVAFASDASNLVAGDENRDWDIFVHDTQTGLTRLLSVAADGTQGNGDTSDWASISGDGRYVVFNTDLGMLVEGDSNQLGDVFRVVNGPVPGPIEPRCADVEIATLALTGPQKVQPSESLEGRLELVLENTGEISTGRFNVQVVLSDDEDITEDDIPIGRDQRVDALAPGESVRVELDDLNVPDDLDQPEVWIGVLVDVAEEVIECDETGNVASISVTYGCPDLLPAGLSMSGDRRAAPGEPIGDTLAASVVNAGFIPTDGLGFDVSFYLSTDPFITTDDWKLTDGTVSLAGPLDVGEIASLSIPTSMSVPLDAPVGLVYLGMIVDESDEIEECDELNNTLATRIFVTAPGAKDALVKRVTF